MPKALFSYLLYNTKQEVLKQIIIQNS